jgi:hypothetical protein
VLDLVGVNVDAAQDQHVVDGAGVGGAVAHERQHLLGQCRGDELAGLACGDGLDVERVGVDAHEPLARPVEVAALGLQVGRRRRDVDVELAGDGGLGGRHAAPVGCAPRAGRFLAAIGAKARCSNSS